MPRRPRPAYRLPPKSSTGGKRQQINPPKSKRALKTRLAENDHILDGEARRLEGSSRTLSQKKSQSGKQLQAGPSEVKLPLNSGRAISRQEITLDEESERVEEGSSEGSAFFEEPEDSGEEDDGESDADVSRVAVWEEDNHDLLVEAFDEEKGIENEVC